VTIVCSAGRRLTAVTAQCEHYIYIYIYIIHIYVCIQYIELFENNYNLNFTMVHVYALIKTEDLPSINSIKTRDTYYSPWCSGTSFFVTRRTCHDM
jgi:hypothetical protein